MNTNNAKYKVEEVAAAVYADDNDSEPVELQSITGIDDGRPGLRAQSAKAYATADHQMSPR